MKVRALGTSGGKSAGNKLTCFLINSTTAIDAGALCSGMTIEEQLKITSVIISHAHLDHIVELPFFVDNLAINGSYVDVFGTEETIDYLKKYIFNNVIWPDFSEIVINSHPVLNYRTIKLNQQFKTNNLQIKCVPVNHIKGSSGFIISDRITSVAFTSDTGSTDCIWKAINNDKKCRSVITECSFPDSMKNLAEISRHFCPETLKADLNKLDKDKKIYIYHLKPQLHKEITETLKEFDITILRDGDLLNLSGQ